MKKLTVDGNFAASNIAYMFNEAGFIYPITPSSPMAENCDKFASENRKNIFNSTMLVSQMQSEGGVAGAVHGSLLAGAKTTTFTSSQGLLLMVPNMYKIAGEGLPTVFYVASRSLATHALNIFCDYSDIYAVTKTGFNIVCCSSVQEVNDLAIACELASVKSNIPYICFFDGFRTSHEINSVYITELEDLMKIVYPTYFAEFKNRSMNNHNPFVAGTNQNPDVFMQNRVLALNKYRDAISDFNWAIDRQEVVTNRHYETIDYIGDDNATHVVVSMGTSADVLVEAQKQYKGRTGVIKVRMLKPFDEERFIKLLPKSVKHITILERNLDVNGVDTLSGYVMACLQKHNKNIKTYSGCYGLGGKEFTPDMAISVFDNAYKTKKSFFTIGVYDDVTNTNLEIKSNVEDKTDFAMRVYGFGSDGSVSSVKNTLKIVSKETASYVQGYFDYDSKKSSSLTISHMRANFLPIVKPYNPKKVNVVLCNNEGYIEKYNLTDCLIEGGTLILNTGYRLEVLNKKMPYEMKRAIVDKKINLYQIDANEIAYNLGLGGKISTIMQTSMFKVTNLVPFNVALENIKQLIVKEYGHKGKNIVNANLKAIENIDQYIKKIDTRKFLFKDEAVCKVKQSEYYEEIIVPTNNQAGNDIPVSKFNEAGYMPTDTSKFNKRALAQELPKWISEKCIQCGRCTMMCPHAAIKPTVYKKKDNQPESFTSCKLFGGEGEYRMQVNTLDCTGCGVCSTVCPVKAIVMTKSEEIREQEQANFEYLQSLDKITPPVSTSVKGLQFVKEYFEHSGACAGCGETPYIKLITQLFGERMLIANATGCSSIYGGTFPTCPYSKDKDGFGPTWANSLFEDNAEFGYGIAVAKRKMRNNFINNLKNMHFSAKISEIIKDFIKNPNDNEICKKLIIDLKQYKLGHQLKKDDGYLYENINLITNPSMWIVGGDGWAYDIGFGGLDHVVASGEDVNILILDTEVYSNTGGQTSKSTPRGAKAKFNINGKTTRKKDLASMLMTYKDVYVAQVCMGANPEQCVKAMVEAENYKGPSVIIAYSPCVNHGYDMRYSQMHAFYSVKSGYNTLFRYNPEAEEKMQIDSYEPTMDYENFIETETRFSPMLSKKGKNLIKKSKKDAENRRRNLKRLK